MAKADWARGNKGALGFNKELSMTSKKPDEIDLSSPYYSIFTSFLIDRFPAFSFE